MNNYIVKNADIEKTGGSISITFIFNYMPFTYIYEIPGGSASDIINKFKNNNIEFTPEIIKRLQEVFSA